MTFVMTRALVVVYCLALAGTACAIRCMAPDFRSWCSQLPWINLFSFVSSPSTDQCCQLWCRKVFKVYSIPSCFLGNENQASFDPFRLNSVAKQVRDDFAGLRLCLFNASSSTVESTVVTPSSFDGHPHPLFCHHLRPRPWLSVGNVGTLARGQKPNLATEICGS